MPQPEIQVNSPQQMTPDEAAAALAFATNLSNQLLPKAQPEQPQTPTNASASPQEQPKEAQPAKEEKAPEKPNAEDLREEIKAIVKEVIEEALSEDTEDANE